MFGTLFSRYLTANEGLGRLPLVTSIGQGLPEPLLAVQIIFLLFYHFHQNKTNF